MRWNLFALVVLLLLGSQLNGASTFTPILIDAPAVNVIGALSTDGTNVYAYGQSTPDWSSRMMLKIDLSTGAVTTLSTGTAGPSTVIGSSLYWIDSNGGTSTGTIIKKVSLTGGSATVIYDGVPAGQPIMDGDSMVTDGSKLYISDDYAGGVFSMNPDGSGITRIGANRYATGFSNERNSSLAISGNTLYVSDGGKGTTPGTFDSLATAGGAYTHLYSTSTAFEPDRMTVLDDNIYMLEHGRILVMSTAGGTPAVFATASDSHWAQPWGITSYENTLYVSGLSASGAEGLWSITVPEPMSLSLLGLGTLVLLGRKTRRAGR